MVLLRCIGKGCLLWEMRLSLTLTCAILLLLFSSCSEEIRGVAPPPGKLHYPIGIAADPAGDYLYVVNSNFDVGYTGGTVVPVDVATHRILSESAIEVGSFAGELALLKKEGKATAGLLAVRGDRAVTWFKIERDKDSKPLLTCSEKPRTAGVAQKCDGDYILRGGDEDPIGRDPFAVEIFHDRRNDRDFALVGSIDSGTVALFSVGDDLKPVFEGNRFISRGIHSIKSHPQSGDIYITSRFVNTIFAAGITYKSDQEGDHPEITSEIPIVISTAYGSSYTNADFSRGIVFGSGGSRCYVSFRAPSSLLVFDTSIENGSPKNLLTGIIPLEKSPAGLAVIGNGAGGKDMVYAVSFETDSVWVIDPDKMLVVDSIKVGDGPYSIVSIKRDDLNIWRAYVTNFNGHSVSVIDVDPQSPNFNSHIAEIM